ILKLNNSKEHYDVLADDVIRRLNWISFEECIDIRSIFIIYETETSPLDVEVKFFNNGVIYMDEDKVDKILIELFEIFK
uniref:hypothetical protein n=1 Tax=Paraclostridium bifermentans TaxID=1490 RepID=UPI0022E4E62C